MLDWNQLRQWYLNNMTKILEARILIRRGNVFYSVYIPKPWNKTINYNPHKNTLLFYWSALDWMDVENNDWWHGDRLGYYKMTAPDGAWSIDGAILRSLNGLRSLRRPLALSSWFICQTRIVMDMFWAVRTISS